MKPIDAFLEILRSEGVSRIFGNPGTTELPFTEALASAPDLAYTLGLHEGSVVSMADGYARATGRPAVVNLHVAAGVANGLVGIMNASRSRTPLVVTAGQQDRRHRLADPMLSGDLVTMASAWTKSAVEVQHAADLPVVLRRAFALAARPPSGPVLVSIPMDLLDESTDVAVPGPSPAAEPGPAGGIAAAAAILAGAAAPAIVAGDGVGRAGALDELVAVAEALGAAVYQQPMFDWVNVPGNHPLYVGALPPTAAGIRSELAAHDVVLIVGCHAFMVHHYTPGGPIPEATTVVQLDDDPTEPARNFPVAAALVGGIRPSLRELACALDGALDSRAGDVAERTRAIARRSAEARTAAAAEVGASADRGGPPFDPIQAMAVVATAARPETVFVEEGITVGLHLRRLLRQDRPRSYVHTLGAGLGWGIGAAIGTRLGDPTRPVVAVLGDGCAMFGLQGLWTAAHERVPVLFLVMANGEYRTLKETLDRRRGTTASAPGHIGLDMTDPTIDWSAAGRMFGIRTHRLERLTELTDLVRGAAELDGPLLVDVPITPHAPSLGAAGRGGGHR